MGVISRNNELLVAYLQTEFTLEKKHKFSLTQASPAFVAFLKANKIKSWAVITAYNPLSEPLTETENSQANDRLESYLVKRKLVYFPCDSLPSKSGDKGERGFLVANITRGAAAKMGRSFNQNAVVFGYKDGQCEILWCAPGFLTSDFRSSSLEDLFWKEVTPCSHGLECTTGCPDKFANHLSKNGLSPQMCEFLLVKWKETGFHSSFSKTLKKDEIVALKQSDLEYKRLVVKRMKALKVE